MDNLTKIWKWIFPEGNTRVHSLDVLRTLAIISVIFYHLPKSENQTFFRAITHFGNYGVDLFFVLSGYLIGEPVFKKIQQSANLSLKTFYIKRFFRTLPSYYFVLILNIIIYGPLFFDWRYAFFMQNFGGLYSFTESWSLCIEEHFYLTFPVIVAYFQYRKKLHHFPYYVLLIFIIGFIWRTSNWFILRPDLIYAKSVPLGYEIFFKNIFYPTIGRLDGIAFGTLIAFYKINHKNFWDLLLSKSHYLLLSGIFTLIIAIPFIYLKVDWFNVIFGFPIISFAFSLILISANSPNSFLNYLKIPGITTISLLSYSLYLTHGWAIDLIVRLCLIHQIEASSYPIFLAMILLSIFFAFILYIIVERNFLLIRHKILRLKNQ